MSPEYSSQILELNAQFDPLEVLQKMGIEGDAIYVEGNQIRLYCPIHRDIVKRSMIVDAGKRTYYCQHKQCEAHKGGPLIELYAMFYDISIEETIEHLKAGPMDHTQLVMEADRMIDRGELSSAIPILQKVLESDPTNATNRCKLAALYLELGTKDEGFQEYLRAAEDFAVKGQLEKTVSIYKLLLIISPNNIMLRHNLFHIFMRLKMNDQAVEQLKYAADFLFQRKEYAQTLKVCQEMLEAMPAEPSIREFYARVLEVKGQTFEAAQEAETAAKLYFELDRLRESRTALEFGLKLQPNNRILLELQKELERKRESVRGGFDESSVVGRDAMSEEDFENWLKDIEEEVDDVGGEDDEYFADMPEAPAVAVAAVASEPEPDRSQHDTPFTNEAPFLPQGIMAKSDLPPAPDDFSIDMGDLPPDEEQPIEQPAAPPQQQAEPVEMPKPEIEAKPAARPPLPKPKSKADRKPIAPSEIPLPDIEPEQAPEAAAPQKAAPSPSPAKPRKVSQVPFGRPASVFDIHYKSRKKTPVNDALNAYVFQLDERQLQRTGLYLAEVMSKVRVSHNEGALQPGDVKNIEQFYESFRAAREAAYHRNNP
ncbi:hypothetical protein JXA32_13550 [Candidatus Sumerlaeota bacterium]|nr:hypothetical protein [Candidatus Sumerlaeota bacterium]